MNDTPMTEDEIVTALQTEYEGSESYRDSQLADEQAAAIDYYEGRPLGNEVDGRSQIVMNVVQETVDYMAISVLRLFVSGDQVVEFEATEEEYAEAAEEATEAISYNFMRKQDGYNILHSVLHSGLLERYGAVKTACETVERVTRETVQVDADMLTALENGILEDVDAELENSIENEDGSFNAILKYEKTEKRYIDIPIPTEEFRFSSRAIHEDDADYLAHVCRKTRSELVEMGFDRKQVYDLPTHEADIIDERQYSRDRDDYWREEDSSPALQEVLFLEEYARMDVDGDGIAERVKVCRVADQILIGEDGKPSIETIDEQPICVFTPFPRAHRMVGNSLADKTMDIHSIKTVTARQLMDGMYSSNMPRPLVDMSNLHESTIEDLLTPVPGAPIRYNGQAPIPYQTNFDVSKSLAVLEYWTGEQESQTGITRLNQGLDADTLNKTATGTAMLQAQGQQYEEFIARNFAEMLSRLFAKKLRLMKREGEKFNIKMGGTYKQVDPSQWPEDFNVNIKVGLGTGRKDQRVQHRMMVLELQREAMEIGLADKQRLYNSAGDLVKDLGLGQPDRYFVDPDDPESQQGEGQEDENPDLVAAQLKAQNDAAKIQNDYQLKVMGMQAKANETVQKLQIEREKLAQQQAMAEAKAGSEMELAQIKTRFEAQMAKYKADIEAGLARSKMLVQANSQIQMSQNRPGGDLDK